MKKKFLSTALMIAIMLSLSSCQDNSNTYTEILSEEEIAARYSTTTAATSETSLPKTITDDDGITYIFDEDTQLYLPVKTDTEQTTQDTSPITADTREELAKSFLEAILAGDKNMTKRYNVSSKIYAQIQEALSESKAKAGFSDEDVLTIDDFEIYFYGPMWSAYNPTDERVNMTILSKKLSSFSLDRTIVYDYDAEQYKFQKTSDLVNYSDSNEESAINNGYTSKYEYQLAYFLKNAHLVS